MATGRATDPCLTSGVRDLSPYGDSSLSVHMAASEFHAGRYRSSDLRGPCCSDWGLPDYVSLAAVWGVQGKTRPIKGRSLGAYREPVNRGLSVDSSGSLALPGLP